MFIICWYSPLACPFLPIRFLYNPFSVKLRTFGSGLASQKYIQSSVTTILRTSVNNPSFMFSRGIISNSEKSLEIDGCSFEICGSKITLFISGLSWVTLHDTRIIDISPTKELNLFIFIFTSLLNG